MKSIKTKTVTSSSLKKKKLRRTFLYKGNLGRGEFHQFQDLPTTEKHNGDLFIYSQQMGAVRFVFYQRFLI